jgi:hypothetical protein
MFLKRILRKHVFRASAVKMEATRLRGNFDEALGAIGAPCRGKHFLPFVPGVARSRAAITMRGRRKDSRQDNFDSNLGDLSEPGQTSRLTTGIS